MLISTPSLTQPSGSFSKMLTDYFLFSVHTVLCNKQKDITHCFVWYMVA